MKALLIHGTRGSCDENWFPWLRHELETLGVEVFSPQFPTPEQTPKAWFETLERSGVILDEETIIVAHSLGPLFALHALATSGTSVKGSFFVAPFLGELGNDFDALNAPFFCDFDFVSLRVGVGRCTVYASNNDPYVPLGCSMDVAIKLGARISIIKGAGHFNDPERYREFPRLLQDIKELC